MDTLGLQAPVHSKVGRLSITLKDDRVKFHRDMVGLNMEEIMTDFRH